MKELAISIANYIDDKKGEDVVVLDLVGKSSISDYFVIATGRSDRHATSLAKHVEDEVWEHYQLDVHHKEGHHNGDWVVLDYIDIIVHIFNGDKRDYYNLEKIWADAESVIYDAKQTEDAVDR
ncbi:MAG: ribosome silencing factor [Clostridiales bacterium]|nr:MAG: ribosome silencing factor [Clostridiales bacterium]